MALRLVADAAYPFDLDLLPAGVAAVAGYVGGDTPHVWTASEVAEVTASGRQWWAIWTAPSTGQKLTAAQGSSDGAAMAAALNARSYPKTQPVFYDIEQGTYSASPAGARSAVKAWTAKLHAAGWAHAYAYLPWSAQTGWVANWTYTAPASLPAGVVGWQWTSDRKLGKPFDLSSFTDALFEDVDPFMEELMTYYKSKADFEARLEQLLADAVYSARTGKPAGPFTHKTHPNLVDGKGIAGDTAAATSEVSKTVLAKIHDVFADSSDGGHELRTWLTQLATQLTGKATKVDITKS